jgi:serine protease Do
MRKQPTSLSWLAACAVLALGTLVARTESLGPTPPPRAPEIASSRPAAGRDWNLRQTPVVEVVQRVRGAVVNIHSERTAQGTRTDEFFALTPSQSRVNGMGTGVVIDPRGYILTNQHVVDDVHTLRVRLHDGSTAPARVLARDPECDLALLKIEPRAPLTVMPLGTSSDLMVGETVVAIGNAYGYEHTVTVGIVSATGRDVTLNKEVSYKALIQTDASINPGNSGGPLLNVFGELVGLNVAIRAGAQGIGFAIPVDNVVRVAAGLLAQAGSGLTRPRSAAAFLTQPSGARAAIGLTVRDEVLPRQPDGRSREPSATRGDAAVALDPPRLDTNPTRQRGTTIVPDGDAPPRRLVVEAVEPDSPAQRAGVRPGDVLVQAGDVPCASSLDLERALIDDQGNLRGGEHLALRVSRLGSERRLDLVLEARSRPAVGEVPASTDRAPTGALGGPADQVWRRLGVRLLALDAEAVSRAHPQVRLRGGLLVTEVREGSLAERSGIQRNDILIGMHLWEMLSLDNILFVLNHADLATFQPLRFYVLRGGQVHRGYFQAD